MADDKADKGEKGDEGGPDEDGEWRDACKLVMIAFMVNVVLQFVGGLVYWELVYPAEEDRAREFAAYEEVHKIGFVFQF